MSEKSHVGMASCFWCGGHSCILLETRIVGGKLLESLPKECGVVNMIPCNDCEGHMKENIILIGVDTEKSDMQAADRHRTDWDHRWNGRKGPYIPGSNGEIYRSGHFLVVTSDWVQRTINPPELRDQILKCHWTFVDQEICKALIQQHEEESEEDQTTAAGTAEE